MKQFYQIVKRINKKGMGLTDFFSILAFALILLIFYILFKTTLNSKNFELQTESSNIEDSISIINILKTPVIIDNDEISIAELIALSQIDSTKKNLLKKSLSQIINEYFSTAECAIVCINKEQVQSSVCTAQHVSTCSENVITIPTYDTKTIEISLQNNVQEQQQPYSGI